MAAAVRCYCLFTCWRLLIICFVFVFRFSFSGVGCFASADAVSVA